MKILIRLPNWLGDIVMSAAFIKAVTRLHPGATVDVIIKKELGGIAELIPGLNAVHLFSKQEFKGLAGVYRFGKTLRKNNYDIFFTLPSSLSSAVMGWASGARQRAGYTEAGGFFMLTKTCKRPKNVHRVDEYLAILQQFTGKPITEKQVSLNAPDHIPNDRIIVNFNSEAESRRMPLDKGRHLLNLLVTTFPAFRFSLIGSAKDNDYVTDLIEGTTNPLRFENIAGKTSLKELAGLLAGCGVMLSTDSGPAHLANSLGTPTIALFGAGNEHNTAPYNSQNLTVIRDRQLKCEPCVKNTCKLYALPKCMELLDDIKIINALKVYLDYA